MYVLPLSLIWAASWLSSYLASDMSWLTFARAPCLTKSLTQAPSRPTTSDMVPDAAAATTVCLVAAYGPLISLTLIPAFLASKSSMMERSAPAGSSGSHHWANSRVTVPPAAADDELVWAAPPH